MTRLGLVVARHRRHVVIEDSDCATWTCHSASRSIRPLVGDIVQWNPERDDNGVVTSIEPRSTVLTRVDSRGHGQPIAANLTQLVVVIAAEPSIDWLVLDHYLAAAELTKLSPLIVFNKTDIVAQLPAELEIYRRLAPFIATSALEGGLPPSLLEHLAGNRSVLVGQSGVGKSSLLNALFGATLQSVGELSARIRQGRHTTTGSALHRLKNGGELIDSPGVRRYAPWIEHERMVAGGFGEFQPFVARCRFADCSHLNEPNCAVKAAVGSGDIAQRRYASYGNLYELVAQLRTRREN